MFPKIDVWYIEASTGCSCCAYENFNQGFYKTEGEPNAIVSEWRKGNGNPLASQYARYGRYSVHKAEAEVLPDGRLIIEDRVYPGDSIERYSSY